jgi:hypothetical protein
MSVVQESAPHSRLTEALGWTTMGLGAGMALGAGALGALIEEGGPHAGFLGLLGAGALLVLAAAAVPTAGTTSSSSATASPTSEPFAAGPAPSAESATGSSGTPPTAPEHSEADSPSR